MKSLSEIKLRQPSNSNSNDLVLRQDLSPSTLTKINELKEQYPSVMEFGAAFSPDKMDKFSNYPSRCLFGKAPTLIELNLSYQDTASVQWLIAQLSVFQEQLNIPNKMTSFQLDACAQTISERFGYLKTTEIMLFLSRLKGGLYNVDWFGSVNPDKIVKALLDHFIPYRNNLYYKREKAEQERKEKEMREEPAITWEEYCKLKGINKPNPLGQ